LMMHIWSSLSNHQDYTDHEIIRTRPQTATTTLLSKSCSTPHPSHANVAADLPHTSIIAHTPGWTLFRNLYMSNGTLYILSSNRSFPEIRMMTSTGLPVKWTPEMTAAREPTPNNMDYLTPEKALARWGGDVQRGEKNRVWSVDGNTLLFNDPTQFLRHYYHFVAELCMGVWVFWHGAWTAPSTSAEFPFLSSDISSPQIHRAIFAHADGWRDKPGFNAYFLRAAFPSLTVEVQNDWEDRIASTSGKGSQDRAWHFPILLLVDRNAAHRGVMMSKARQMSSEAWEFMRQNNQLVGERVGGWWDPIRHAIWRFAGVTPLATDVITAQSLNSLSGAVKELALPMPDKVVITYISRQQARHRKLVEDDHNGLVTALQRLVKTKGSSWELNILIAEKLSKDEQIQAVARTTILLGVHGNGLTHLIFMKPSRVSAVIEVFYPGGFAHDYQWSSRALGMDYYGFWNDTHFTHENHPKVAYPEGFQKDYIPVNGEAVSRIIEDHVERRRSA